MNKHENTAESTIREQIESLRRDLQYSIVRLIHAAVQGHQDTKAAQGGFLRLDKGYKSYRAHHRVEECIEDIRKKRERILALGELLGEQQLFETELRFLETTFQRVAVNTPEVPELLDVVKKFFSPSKDGQ